MEERNEIITVEGIRNRVYVNATPFCLNTATLDCQWNDLYTVNKETRRKEKPQGSHSSKTFSLRLVITVVIISDYELIQTKQEDIFM